MRVALAPVRVCCAKFNCFVVWRYWRQSSSELLRGRPVELCAVQRCSEEGIRVSLGACELRARAVSSMVCRVSVQSQSYKLDGVQRCGFCGVKNQRRAR